MQGTSTHLLEHMQCRTKQQRGSPEEPGTPSLWPRAIHAPAHPDRFAPSRTCGCPQLACARLGEPPRPPAGESCIFCLYGPGQYSRSPATDTAAASCTTIHLLHYVMRSHLTLGKTTVHGRDHSRVEVQPADVRIAACFVQDLSRRPFSDGVGRHHPRGQGALGGCIVPQSDFGEVRRVKIPPQHEGSLQAACLPSKGETQQRKSAAYAWVSCRGVCRDRRRWQNP